jgi:hypothetical protein
MTAVQRQHLCTARASGQRPKGFNTEDVRGPRRATEDWYARFRAVNLNSVALRGPRTSSVLNLFGRCTEALAVQVC